MRRVLRPGGRVVFIEHVRAPGVFGHVQDALRPVWGWFGAGCHPNRRTEDAFRDARWQIEIQDRHRVAGLIPILRGQATPSL